MYPTSIRMIPETSISRKLTFISLEAFSRSPAPLAMDISGAPPPEYNMVKALTIDTMGKANPTPIRAISAPSLKCPR